MSTKIAALVCAILALFTASFEAFAEAAEFRGLGGGSTTAYAAAVSGDGTVVAGFNFDGTVGYRWTESGGVTTFAFQPSDVSFDGSVIVGIRNPGATEFEAVRWTQAGGVVGLGDLSSDDGSVYSSALGVSGDGSVVVGSTAGAPFKWTALAGGMSAWPPPPDVPAEAYNGFNSGVSADGSITAGGYQIDVAAPPPLFMRTETHYFRAVGGKVADEDKITAMSLLSSASGISGNGQVIFGQASNQAAFWSGGNVHNTVGPLASWFDGASFTGDCIVGTSMSGTTAAMIWDDVHEFRDLRTVLENDFGLAAELSDWTLTQANDVSDDCTTIVGTGIYQNTNQAWIVTNFSKNGLTSTTTTTIGGQPKCAQPVSAGSLPVASDCLFILRVAVGNEVCPSGCICAPKGTLPTTATDALLCLKTAVGQSVTLSCPCAG